MQQPVEAMCDIGGAAEATIGEAGVELDGRGTGLDLGIGLFGAGHTAHADQGDVGKAVQPGEHQRRFLEQRLAGQAALFAGMGAGQAGAVERGVGGDDGMDPRVLCHLGDVGEVLIRQVGGDFQKDRHCAAHLHHAVEQSGERHGPLQVPQFFGVGAGDVDGGKVDMGGAVLQHAGEVFGPVGAVLVGTEVEADGYARRPLGQTGCNGLHPVIVEAEAVDGGCVLGQAKEAWFRVARLRQRCGGPDLEPAEACAGQRGDGGRVLVEPGRKAHRVGQGPPGEFGHEARAGHRAGQGGEAGVQRLERQSVGRFGIEAAQGTRADPLQCLPHPKVAPPSPGAQRIRRDVRTAACRCTTAA